MVQYAYLKLGYDTDKLTKESAIALLNEWSVFVPGLLSCEETEEGNLKETRLEILKALRKAAIEADWQLSDVTEVLAEINNQDFCYPESINILKEILHIVNQDYQSDWRLELTKIIEKRQQYIQEYERQKNFERNLHDALEITKEAKKEVRKKKIVQELEDTGWTIQTLERILDKYASTGPHTEMASDLSEVKKRKHILLRELASMDKEITENMKLSENGRRYGYKSL